MFKYIVFTSILFITLFLHMNNFATIESKLDLPDVSSGSGLAIVEDKTFIVGDDSPYLYELNMEYVITNKHLLLEGLPTEGRIPKAIKPDFECLAEERSEAGTRLYMFGSGSKSPERDLLVIYDPVAPESLQQYLLTDFYQKFIEKGNMPPEQLNLEAAVMLGDKLYLFNRGHNQLATVSLPHFKNYLQSRGSAAALADIDIKVQDIKLPVVEGIQARFSGACNLPGSSSILFSATLEDTDNWIDDGEILGSMLGVIDTQHPDSFSEQDMVLIRESNGQTAAEKIESISFIEQDAQGQLHLLAVADNDDGSSRLFTLKVDRKFLKKSP